MRRFGELSGLQVQPSKSCYIFLNTTIKAELVHGIPVLQYGTTTRYLGYQVGTGELRAVNWADRQRRPQRRLMAAASKHTSVADRVLILNVIMLPAMLYTAIMFQPTQNVIDDLERMQKQFLWRGVPELDRMRHKMTQD